MAKARIVYEVDDKALQALRKRLQELRDLGHDIPDGLGEGFDDLKPKIKETTSQFDDLKKNLLGLATVGTALKLAKDFAGLVVEVNKSRKEVALLTGEVGKSLDVMTAKIRATSTTFNKDFNEVLRAANTLSKEFGVSLSESIESVNEGFLRGLDANGEYLDTLREYSTFIKEAGLNQEQFNVLIQKQVTQGIYSDKGIDAIKEAVISIREMAPATKQAIDAVGINSNKLIQDITAGTKTYFEAVQEIARKTQEVADPTKTGAILADVFRGAGEDAGRFIFTLGDVQNGYSEVTGEQAKYIEGQRRLLETSENLNSELVTFSSNFSSATVGLRTFTNTIATESLKALNAFIGSFISLDERIDSFNKSIQTLELKQLQDELAELEKGPGSLAQFGAFLSGGPGAIAEQAAEAGVQIVLLKKRIEELQTEEETNKIVQQNEALAEEAKRRAAVAEMVRKQAEADEKKRQAEAEALNKTRTGQVKSMEAELRQAEIEQLKELDEIFRQEKISDEEELARELAEINRKRLDKQTEDEREHAEKRREIMNASVDGFLDILEGFNQLRIQQIDQELQANEMARNRELELAEGNADRQAKINKKYDEERAKLRTKQVQAQKQQSTFEAIVNTARAVVEALPNIPLSILAGAIGAAQVAFIAAQPIPKFAKGVIGLNGPGTDTSDSIPAYLSRNESVMTARETKDYNATLWAIRKKEIKPEILNKFVLEGQRAPVIINDYDRLAEAVMRQPQAYINMDESGMTAFIQKGINARTIKQNKFKM